MHLILITNKQKMERCVFAYIGSTNIDIQCHYNEIESLYHTRVIKYKAKNIQEYFSVSRIIQ